MYSFQTLTNKTGDIILSSLKEEDIELIFPWFNDPQVVRFTRHAKNSGNIVDNTFELELQYINNITPPQKYHWGIRILEDCNVLGIRTYLVGIISLTLVDKLASVYSIELLIGDKRVWGRGLGTEAIKLVVGYAFKELKIRKLTAGLDARNIGCLKAFEKAGFLQEGILKEHQYLDGIYADIILMGKY